MWNPIREWRNENISVKLMQVGSGMDRRHVMMCCSGEADYQLKIATWDVAAATREAQAWFDMLCAFAV